MDVNCAAIPETLLEAELFGFERGAFTDARRAKPGLFQAAHGGTLFLDEVGAPARGAPGQAPDGHRGARRSAASAARGASRSTSGSSAPRNTDLPAAVRARRFREDLYHRLAVLTLDLPPLRERGRDVLLLAERFLARACADYGLPPKTPGCRRRRRGCWRTRGPATSASWAT